jgi:glyoxylase-like metal-dependent hydrolase (beta-lactamase superfamily II)
MDVIIVYFEQIKRVSDNFSYIIANETTKEAAVVDPSYNSVKITSLLKSHGFRAKYVIDTHYHMDHTTGNNGIKEAFDHAKVIAHKSSRIAKDIGVVDGDIIEVGKIRIQVIHTPGHSPDSICLLFEKKLLTGDTLFVGECGRTDMADGNARDMYHSLFDKLMKLDDDVEVYPGHDYGPKPRSTIGVERKTNYTLEKRTLDEFVEFMKQP